MFEYEVDLSEARSPEDMKFVAEAFRAGELKERERIKLLLDSDSGCGDWALALIDGGGND